VPEPITNKLLISATPRYFPEVMRLIGELDAEQPQVAISVVIADIDLTGNEEFGVEIGLQSPVLFQRGVIPAFPFAPKDYGPGNLLSSATTQGTVSYTNATGGLVPPGVTVSNTINPVAQPGFAFNNTGALGNNPVVGPGVVGFQGISNLGVGRVSPTSNVGGFVFSASSDTFSLLVRALKTQGRLEILNRPMVTATDKQTASLLVGSYVPYVTGAAISTLGTVTPTINYRETGVILNVTPSISPEGKVIMRVHPEVSQVSPTTINLGNGILATQFLDEYVDTTVIAQDGETVCIGGLINKRDDKTEAKVPWLGDLPGVGTLFRYRTQVKEKRELIVILTPHVVRCKAEADRFLSEEARRIDWVLGDVIKAHGTSGMEPVFPPPALGSDASPRGPELLPSPTSVMPGTNPPPVAPGLLPPPAIVPTQPPANPGMAPGQGAPAAVTPPGGVSAVTPPAINTANAAAPGAAPQGMQPAGGMGQPAGVTVWDNNQPMPADKGKESDRWKLFRKN
jgi:hypothetical protein